MSNKLKEGSIISNTKPHTKTPKPSIKPSPQKEGIVEEVDYNLLWDIDINCENDFRSYILVNLYMI